MLLSLLLDPTYFYMGFTCVMPVLGVIVIYPGHSSSKKWFCIFRTASSIVVAMLIYAVTQGRNWHAANANISTQYAAFSGRKVEGLLAVKIGLEGVNISLQGNVPDLPYSKVQYTEHILWTQGVELRSQYRDSLQKGLPYPILTAVDYLTVDNHSLRWGRHYRQAGYYTLICLWLALFTWLTSVFVWLLDLDHSAVSVCRGVTGLFLLTAVFLYSSNLPKRDLVIPYEDNKLLFQFGWCFYTTFILGLTCMIWSAISWSKHLLPRTGDSLDPGVWKDVPLALRDQYRGYSQLG